MLRTPAAFAQQFAFAFGRMSVLKHLLLVSGDRDRMLGAHGLQEAEAILSELKLGSRTDKGDGKADTVLSAIGPWMRKEVETMAPPEQHSVFHILWMEEDAPLIAYLLKEYHGLTSAVSTPPAGVLTTWNPEKVHDLVRKESPLDEEVEEQYIELQRLIDTVKALQKPTAKDVDHAVCQGIATMRLALAKQSGSAEIRRYVRHTIDLANIRTALRLEKAQPAETSRYLIAGGSLSIKTLAGDHTHILGAIDRSSLPFTLSQNLQKAGDDWNAVEQTLQGVLAEDISRMWNVPMTVEPLFAFAALALSHLKLLRAIIIGKRANMTPQEIKRILPPFISSTLYVLS